jgi:adenosylcobinamide-GDP ribazoletransferase
MGSFLAAVQFLTIVPAPGNQAPARGAMFFPVVGAGVGLAAGGIRLGAARMFPPSIAALLALGFLMVITGALHEDGLADVLDAFRAGRSPERIQAILKDSRIGVYGATGLLMITLLRWQAIEFIDGGALPALIAAAGASRGVMVVFAHISRPIGDGLGKAFCLGLRRRDVVLAGLQSAALPFLCGPVSGALGFCGNAVAILAARAYFHRRAGGVTGDCMGAVCLMSETITLLLLVWLRST